MPKRMRDGWFTGMGEGLRDSGWFTGMAVPAGIVILFFTIIIGGGVLTYRCVVGPTKPEPPKPCNNYSYKMAIVGSSKAQCTKWPSMSMKIEKRWVKADVVHCKCNAESNTVPE